MNYTPFKTPLPRRTPIDRKMGSDSDESIASTNSDNAGGGSSTPSVNGAAGSLVVEFDDLMRQIRPVKVSNVLAHESLLYYLDCMDELLGKYREAMEECRRLQSLVESKVQENTDLEHKLFTARRLMDVEKHHVREARRERDSLASEINLVRNILFKEKGISEQYFPEEMRQKLSFLHNNNIPSDTEMGTNGHQPQLSAIKEINSTGSILSDFSYSRSEDDLDSSHLESGKAWRKHRPSCGGGAEPAAKKRRSSTNKAVEIAPSDTVRATTTLTVPREGPITATSVIESVPKTPLRSTDSETTIGKSCMNGPPASLVFDHWARGSPLSSDRKVIERQHCFQQKTMIMPTNCGVCEERIRFGKTSVKCKECKAMCHVDCRDKLPLPCIPSVNTPNQKNIMGVIGDYTPTNPPMVPAILIHCINEIELRGLTEVGIYRVPGAERDVKALKERFLRGKGSPCVNDIDVHVLCGTVKLFLRSLHEPLITYALWKKFVNAAEIKEVLDAQSVIYQLISGLPQPNRDTLAYMMLHLQKVSEAKSCKMDVTNLSKVFGPTIIGFSSEDLSPNEVVNELADQQNVMQHFLRIETDYWASFINVQFTQPSRLQQTPSTDSLLRSAPNRSIFTPNGNRRRQKYFPSPKH